jgi:hypothetical protein
MSGSPNASVRYRWRVEKAREHALEDALNRLDGEWEIFSVTPTIHFGKKVMGAPVPSEILYTIVIRQPIQG